MTPQEMADQINQWYFGGQGRVTQLPGKAAPSTQKFYSTHKGTDFAMPAGSRINTEGLQYLNSGIYGGYGQRLAAYDPRRDMTVYFSHLSGVKPNGAGFEAFTGGVPGTYGAGNTTGAHVDVEYAKGRQPLNFAQMIQRTYPKNTNYRQMSSQDILGLARKKYGNKVIAVASNPKRLDPSKGKIIKIRI
jgi:hypothetical protein